MHPKRGSMRITTAVDSRSDHLSSSHPPLVLRAAVLLCCAEIISVITCDGRNIVGFLRGFDQTCNLILDECHERIYSSAAGVEQVPLGLYIIRGDNVAIVGEVDEEKDLAIDHATVKAEPLKPVVH